MVREKTPPEGGTETFNTNFKAYKSGGFRLDSTRWRAARQKSLLTFRLRFVRSLSPAFKRGLFLKETSNILGCSLYQIPPKLSR